MNKVPYDNNTQYLLRRLNIIAMIIRSIKEDLPTKEVEDIEYRLEKLATNIVGIVREYKDYERQNTCL